MKNIPNQEDQPTLNMHKDKSIGFGLRQIETNQFATLGDGKCDADQLTEQLEFSFGTVLEEQVLGCIFNYTLKFKEQLFLTIEVACSFHIIQESWSELLNFKKQQLVLPKKFAQHIANITVGTARGILHAKTDRTLFNKYPIALINLEEIFDNDAVISLAEDNK